jgi:hypothetical protein
MPFWNIFGRELRKKRKEKKRKKKVRQTDGQIERKKP